MAQASGQEFYIGVASRILIFALAAVSLNLILGFGGMVSFGHAAYLGMGAYTVGILMFHGVTSAWLAWPWRCWPTACLRWPSAPSACAQRCPCFIMITLAFAQMLYYIAVSVKAYGGDDGLSLASRSTLLPGVDLADDRIFASWCWCCLCWCSGACSACSTPASATRCRPSARTSPA